MSPEYSAANSLDSGSESDSRIDIMNWINFVWGPRAGIIRNHLHKVKFRKFDSNVQKISIVTPHENFQRTVNRQPGSRSDDS